MTIIPSINPKPQYKAHCACGKTNVVDGDFICDCGRAGEIDWRAEIDRQEREAKA